jgi:hypothetical protein
MDSDTIDIRSIVFRLDFIIFSLDLITFITSLIATQSHARNDTVAYFVFFVAYVLIHLVCIFHIFYATAKPPKQQYIETRAQQQSIMIQPSSNDIVMGVTTLV